MAEQKTNKKKIIAIVVAAVVALAVIVTAVVLLLNRNGGEDGPLDPNGEPLYPKTATIREVEYLHRGGINTSTGVDIDEKELTDKDDIATFMENLKAIDLRDATDEDRANVDYTADVDMFTIETKEDGETTVLIMGDSISIGTNFYMTDGIDMKALTSGFGEVDYSNKIVSAGTDTTQSDAAEVATSK